MTTAPLEFLTTRRSATTLGDPGLTHAQLDQLLLATSSVPDHGLLRPFRFAVIEGDGRAAFGNALAEVARERRPETPDGKLDAMRAKAFRSPTLIALIASPKPGKIEVWEQHVTAACAGYAIVLAAHALGIGAVWKSVPFTKGTALAALFGLSEAEEMLGFIHLGKSTKEEPAPPRAPLDLSTCTILVDGTAAKPYLAQPSP